MARRTSPPLASSFSGVPEAAADSHPPTLDQRVETHDADRIPVTVRSEGVMPLDHEPPSES